MKNINYFEAAGGVNIYREENGVGGYKYISDECGIGHEIWDTTLTHESSLIAALLDYERIKRDKRFGK